MSSKIDIQKRCKWCGAIFTAHKTTTEYCSHRCGNLAYKDKVRKQRIESLQHELGKSIKTPPNLNKEYLTPSEVAELLHIGRTSIYRYIRNGAIKVIRFERKTLVRKADIEEMTSYIEQVAKDKPIKEKVPITDFYTTAEVKEKFNVAESWIFAIAKKNNIPRTFNRGKTYWSKKHMDAYFAKKAPNPDIAEWYSTQEMQEKFGMTLSAIYTFVSKNAIPKKKEGIMVYYSKKHVDIAKGVSAPEEPQYYMVAEAMEKFNLTRDQLYHYTKYHNISKVKKGKYTLISKSELDKLLAAPKIE
ncbi:helix-turn-helix domain-containing protein [Parabacteroides sp. AF17-28]|uniref:helix-turn-helix domain-containing protein n=1 Tax=Parabacteroides sp. AF17-28 TaxID=2292241 RepID=UPI000EFDE664|nr:helix-turn-helix domain-containing protein [Parabacteroides sp. AF17-28]RHR53310.1 DNA-binding protein [Parabacteroides sp. AF17-28]